MSHRPVALVWIITVHQRGLSLIEVLIVLCLITVLAVVSLPMLTRANGQARSTACQANLTAIGNDLDAFEWTHGKLPALMNREDASLDVPTLDALFAQTVGEGALFHCPSDDRGLYERSGSSYRWYADWDGRRLDDADRPATPIVTDKAPFHRDQRERYNALFYRDADDAGRRPGLAVSGYAMPE